jgi:hypothetical protein
MASTILSDNGVSSGSAGLKSSADSTGALALQTTTAGGAATTAVTIDTSQNVGIGTASPQGKLQVFASTDDNLIVTGHVNATDGPALKAMDSTAANYKACEVLSAELRLGGTNSVRFGTSGAGGSTERMRIDSSGNVKLSTAGTTIQNSSGNPILQQTGSVLQVVSTFKNDTFSSASATFVDITGLSVSITPTSTTSKILILVTSNVSNNTGNAPTAFNLVRNSTNIATPATSPTYNGTVTPYTAGNISDQSVGWSTSFLDSPATTSATTYKVQGRGSAGTFYVNRRATADFNGTSSITVMEIAA